MRYSSRFFLYAPFAVLCALFALTALWWMQSASAWSQRLDALNGREVMPGIRMQFAAKTVGGFPFRIDTALKDFTLAASGPRAFTWRSEEFALHRLTYGDTRMVFEAGGVQRFSWRRENGSTGAFTFLPGSIRASAILRDGGLARFDAVLVALDAPSLTIGHAELHLRASPVEDALDLVVGATSIQENGKPHADIQLRASIAPRKPLHRLLYAQQDWRTVFEAWRNSGGTFKAQAQNDTVALDASHRLTGHLMGENIHTAPLY
jgi:hypothetical protein